MKSHILFTCIIAMLLISTTSLAEILETHDWDGNCGGSYDKSEPGAYADDNNRYVYKWGDGWQYKYTTVGGEFWYKLQVEASASAWLSLYDGDWASAVAIADASASGGGDSVSMFASVDLFDSGYDGEGPSETDWPDPYYAYVTNSANFGAYEGVLAEHTAIAIAEVHWNGSSSMCGAQSHAETELMFTEEFTP